MEAKRTRWPRRGSRAWLPAAMYVLGMAVIVAFAYRNLVTIPFDSWLNFLVVVVVWALIPWWITAGIAAPMGWGPREIAAGLCGPIGK